MIDQRDHLAEHGMYRPDSESDACGVGLVAAVDGKPSRRAVRAVREGRDVSATMHKHLKAKAASERKAA